MSETPRTDAEKKSVSKAINADKMFVEFAEVAAWSFAGQLEKELNGIEKCNCEECNDN